MDIISRQGALAQGLKRYYTGNACKHGHIVERQVSGKRCVECKRKSDRKQAKTEKRKRYKKEYRRLNRDEIKQYNTKYNNTEKRKQCQKEYRETHREERKEWCTLNKDRKKQYDLNYKAKYPEKVMLRKHEYLSRKTEATPQWYEAEQINQLYRKRDQLSKLWDIVLHVDHIVPLQGKNVCGLHCWDNLQLLEAGINQTKNNHFSS